MKKKQTDNDIVQKRANKLEKREKYWGMGKKNCTTSKNKQKMTKINKKLQKIYKQKIKRK